MALSRNRKLLWKSCTLKLSGKRSARKFIWIEGSGVLGCDTVWLDAQFLMLWRYCDALIFQEPLTQLHSITSQKTWNLSSTVVRTLGLKFCELSKECAWGNIIQFMKSDVAAALVSPGTVCLWLHCHHWVHEQPVCDCSVIIQSMNILFVTAA